MLAVLEQCGRCVLRSAMLPREAIEKHLTGKDLHEGPFNLDEVASYAPDLTGEDRAQITMMARVMESRFLNGS